jgi:hypothetical protein
VEGGDFLAGFRESSSESESPTSAIIASNARFSSAILNSQLLEHSGSDPTNSGMGGKRKQRLGEGGEAQEEREDKANDDVKIERGKEGERNRNRRKRERREQSKQGLESNEQNPRINGNSGAHAIQNKAKAQRSPKTLEGKNQAKPKPGAGESGADSNKWNFQVEYNDHFETPLQAYVDLVQVLKQAADDLGKPLEELIVYDPYYCEGRMVSLFLQLGIRQVINRNQDFYLDISSHTLPGRDHLL